MVEAQNESLFRELALFGTVATSAHPEFPSPRGVKLLSAWDFLKHWRFRLSYSRLWDESEKPGLVCRMYAPNIGCTESMTFSRVALSGLRGSLLRTRVLGPGLRVGLGGGLSFNEVNARSVGEDGRKADLLAPNSGHLGYLVLTSIQWILPLPLPLRLSGSLGRHWVVFRTCSGETPPQYDPYCEVGRFLEMDLGLSVMF